MAPGYVVAAFLEAAGVIGLVVALLKMRTERQSKVADLRSYLRSGLIPSAALDLSGSRLRADHASRGLAIPFAPERSGAQSQPSAAREALGRAIARGGSSRRVERGAAITAG
jgi:hypothetical protein